MSMYSNTMRITCTQQITMQCTHTECILVCCNLVLPLSVGLWVRHLPRKQLTQYQTPHSQWVFCQSRHTNDLKMGALVATLPCLCGLVGKASAFRAADPISNPAFPMGFLPGKSYQWLEHGYSRLPYQLPGIRGSVLGLVGLVSIYCDQVR